MRIGVILAVFVVVLTVQAGAAENSNWLDLARDLRARTEAALRAGDREAAWRLNAAGRALQPGHTGLIRQAIGIADEVGDAARLLDGLERLGRAGSFMDLDTLNGTSRLPEEALAAIRKQFAANRAPVGKAKIAAELAMPDALIESVAFDPQTNYLYLGSVTTRTIYRVDPANGGAVKVFADRNDGLYSVFGMAIDALARRLYVTTGTVPQTPLEKGEKSGTALMVFDLGTGDVLGRYSIDGAKQIADLALADDAVYVTDSGAPRIYRLAANGEALALFTSDPRFVSLQGIAPLGDDLIVADYALGLWRVDRKKGTTTLVRAPDDSPSLLGIDGLSAGSGETLYAVRNGGTPHAVLRLTFPGGGVLRQVETELRGHPLFDEPTLMVIENATAWLVARSQWPLFPADGAAPKRPRANPVILKWQLDNNR